MEPHNRYHDTVGVLAIRPTRRDGGGLLHQRAAVQGSGAGGRLADYRARAVRRSAAQGGRLHRRGRTGDGRLRQLSGGGGDGPRHRAMRPAKSSSGSSKATNCGTSARVAVIAYTVGPMETAALAARLSKALRTARPATSSFRRSA